jgi:hypothetical protein
MSCPVCKYNMVRDIDRALLGGITPAALSRQYPFTPADLSRHQEHLQRKMHLASSRLQHNLQLMLFCKLNTVMEITLAVVHKTKAGEDPKVFLQAGREFTRIISLMDKMAAKLELDPEFIYHLMASHQWDLQEGALLPQAFPAIFATRQTMKQHLFSTCPEPDAAPADDPAIAAPSRDAARQPAANSAVIPLRPPDPGLASAEPVSANCRAASAPPARN